MSPEASRTCLIPELLVGQRLPEVGFVFEVTPSDAWELVWNHVFKWDFIAGKVETNCRRQAIDCIVPLAPGVNLCVTSVGTAHAGRLIVHFYTRSGEPSSYAKWRSEFDSPAPCMIGASAMPCDAPLLSRQTTVQLENGVQCSLLCLRVSYLTSGTSTRSNCVVVFSQPPSSVCEEQCTPERNEEFV